MSDSLYTKINYQWIYDRVPFMGSDMKDSLYNKWNGLGNVTMLQGCGSRRYIGVIGTEFFLKNFAP